MADSFTQDFMRRMTEGSAQSIDSYNRILDALSSIIDRLDGIDKNVADMRTAPNRFSQGIARDRQLGVDSNRPFGQHHANQQRTTGTNSLIDLLDDRVFKDNLQRGLRDFSEKFGTTLSEISNQLGEELEKQIANSLKNDPITRKLDNAINNLTDRIVQKIDAAGDNSNFANDLQNSSFNTDIQNRQLEHLESIDDSIKELLGRSQGTSDIARGQGSRSSSSGGNRSTRDPFAESNLNMRDEVHGFMDNLEKAFLDQIGGQQIQDILNNIKDKFVEATGISAEKLPDELGSTLGKVLANSVKKFGPINSAIEDILGDFDTLSDKSDELVNLFQQIRENPQADLHMLRMGLRGLDLGGFGKGIAKGAAKLSLFLTAIEIVTDRIQQGGKQILEGVDKLFKAIDAAMNRYYTSREKNLKEEISREQADVRTIIEQPFKILEQAANEVYDAWNANIRLITATQGYDKADLQDLLSIYSQRLQQEGLTSVVASTDIYNNLAKVIQSGLSGNAAVEFAYQATKLNAAIPNQDFFNLVDSYSSVAANAIAAGKSEAEALQIANQSLEDFSNSLLYASRNLVGGYSTGLKNAESIYDAAVKIAQAAKSENINSISSSLLAIQGYVGSIAPDLASSLSEIIYRLATGGNDDSIVALRSLAGINASNTEFIRALSENPSSVLSNMFANLGRMFSDSADAYMEKAEGYASLFGLSSEAFQRIDFMSLANAISNMSDNSKTLAENMKLLKSGETTTNADQLKIAQINQYLIDEGLSYVIDNQAAQMIQQHMWDEQLNRELMEATYGVELVGGAAEAINSIASGVGTILDLVNPKAWLSTIGSLGQSFGEAQQLESDIKAVLEAGKVGKGNQKELYQLITRGQDLRLVRDLVDLLGGKANYDRNKSKTSGVADISSWMLLPLMGPAALLPDHPVTELYDNTKTLISQTDSSYLLRGMNSTANGLPTSKYGWGSIAKSAGALSSVLLMNAVGEVSQEAVSNTTGFLSRSVELAKEKIQQMVSDEYLSEQFAKQGKSYQDWLQSAVDMGITDVESVLTDAGYVPSEVESYFKAKQAEAGMAENLAIQEEERLFRQTSLEFMNVRFWDEFNTPLTSTLTTMTDQIVGKIDELIAVENEQSLAHLASLNLLNIGQQAWSTHFDELFNAYTISHDKAWTDWTELFSTSFTEYRDQFDTAWIDWHDYFDTAWLQDTWKTDFVGEAGLFTQFFDEFVKKFVEHTYYDESGYKYSDVTDMQRREDAERGDAVYALADALTDNLVDLKDPQVQTNALLSQILVVATAIMNQNNNVAGTVSLSDALSSLALGLTTTTPLTETPLETAAG